MGPRRCVVGRRAVGGPDRVSKVDDLHHVICRAHLLLLQALNLDPVVRVLHHLKLFLVVQQVDNLPTVNLVDRNREYYLLTFLRSYLEKLLHRLVSISVHSKSFARSRLPISEQGHHSLFKHSRQQRLDLVLIDIIRRLLLIVALSKLTTNLHC